MFATGTWEVFKVRFSGARQLIAFLGGVFKMMGDFSIIFFSISGQIYQEVGAARIKTESWNLDTFAKKWVMIAIQVHLFHEGDFFRGYGLAIIQ